MSRAHALLSASAAHRWIPCPPSALLQEKYEDEESEYAAQGTAAHTLAEWKVRRLLGEIQPDPRQDLVYFNQEMEDATDRYAEYIAETITEAKEACPDPCVMVEQQVDFSRWVPEAFGTADAIIAGSGHLWITDLKYGTGVEVLAEGNPQISCYALGCLELLDDLYDIDLITMQIFQPRRGHISEWTVSKGNLLKWAEETLRPAAELAAAGKGDFCPGDHCRFCKARHECRARADQQMALTRYDFELPPTLTDEEIEDILGRVDHLVFWAEDIKAYALKSALGGKHWNGFKLVEGRSVRRYTDEEAAAKAVQADGKDPYERKLLSVPAMTQLLGRKHFYEVLGGLVEKPRGKATLVPESDKRPAMDFTDFNNEEKKENEENE